MAKISTLGGPSDEGVRASEPQETYLVDDGDDTVTNATEGNPSLVRNGRLLSDDERDGEVSESSDGTKDSRSSRKPSTSESKNAPESRAPARSAGSRSASEATSDKSSVR